MASRSIHRTKFTRISHTKFTHEIHTQPLFSETLAQVFSCEFCEIYKNNFLHDSSGRLLLDFIKILLTSADSMVFWSIRSVVKNRRSRNLNKTFEKHVQRNSYFRQGACYFIKMSSLAIFQGFSVHFNWFFKFQLFLKFQNIYFPEHQ